LLVLFAVAVKLPLFLHPQEISLTTFSGTLLAPLVTWVGQLTTHVSLVFSLFAFVLLVGQALFLNYFFNRHRLTSRPTDLPGMSYLLCTSLLPEWSQWSAPLLINFLVLFLLHSLFESYHRADSRASLFNMGLVIGLGCFFYLPSFFVLVWFLLSLLIIRPVRMQEILIALLGVGTPFYFLVIGLFWTDQLMNEAFRPHFAFSFPTSAPTVWLGGLIFLLAIPLLIGFYHIQDQVRKMLIQVRRGWTVLFFLLLTSLLMPLFSNRPYEGWIVLTLPLAVYHASFYYYTSFRIFPLLFFWVSFFFILLNQYAGSWGKIIFVP
jgi:hypothetical protein